ncbi:hypothetical protein [Massilia antarctica]|uniref:hypothetical protein n=1 Tax=Massilia antarctica TaxID=2765360 RepID=UPI0006BB87BB|nr:hypothetical protein [Massilia sp. H27-R4]MCY0912595.1 hypothetical protein [Massilia sp. H27-R4]CUI03653.1 hypothetical protein BN2497_2083 [Janthinobacterium sp. CG23_2]CUU27439.1 hypothetical protein BN3177_2083 [Janthinobacterium sp. CG23_2]
MSTSSVRTILAFLVATALALPASAAGLDISLKHGSAHEQDAKTQLERLTATYDLSTWIQTDKIVIDEKTIPHSHPVLTLHAKHHNDDGALVSTFIHEQMHWWLSRHRSQTRQALRAIRQRYPVLPVGYPDGADSLAASQEHLLVICLELDGVEQVLGKAEHDRLLAYWSNDHYKKLYEIVARDREQIGAIVRKHQLMP